MLNNLLFSLIVFFATVFSTLVGFGGSTISVPFASLVVDIKKAVPVLTVAFFFFVLGKAWVFRKGIDYRIGLNVIIFSSRRRQPQSASEKGRDWVTSTACRWR